MQSIIALHIRMCTNIIKGRGIYSFEIICLAENTKAFRLVFGFFSLNFNWGWNLTVQRRKKRTVNGSQLFMRASRKERERERSLIT